MPKVELKQRFLELQEAEVKDRARPFWRDPSFQETVQRGRQVQETPSGLEWQIGDRIFYDEAGKLTNQKTNNPAYWSPQANTYVRQVTQFPAVYGMSTRTADPIGVVSRADPAELQRYAKPAPVSQAETAEFQRYTKPAHEAIIEVRQHQDAVQTQLRDLQKRKRQTQNLQAGTWPAEDTTTILADIESNIEVLRKRAEQLQTRQTGLEQDPSVQAARDASAMLSAADQMRATETGNQMDETIIQRSRQELDIVTEQLGLDPNLVDPNATLQYKQFKLEETIAEARKRIEERSEEEPPVVMVLGPDGKPTPIMLEHPLQRGVTGKIMVFFENVTGRAGRQFYERALETEYPLVAPVWYTVNLIWNIGRLGLANVWHRIENIPGAIRFAAEWASDPEAAMYEDFLNVDAPQHIEALHQRYPDKKRLTDLTDLRRRLDAINVARQARDDKDPTFWELSSALGIGYAHLIYADIEGQYEDTLRWLQQTIDMFDRLASDIKEGKPLPEPMYLVRGREGFILRTMERGDNLRPLEKAFGKEEVARVIASAQANAALAENETNALWAGKTIVSETNEQILALDDETIRTNMIEARGYFAEVWENHQARTDTENYAFRHSWVLADDGDARRELANEAIIDAMFQLSRMLEPWEIEEITSRFVDPGAEFGGEMVFDPLNIIPGIVFEKALIAPTKILIGLPFKAIAKTANWIAPVTYQTINGWIRAKSVYSAAWSLVGHRWGRAGMVLSRAAETTEDFKGLLRVVLDPAQDLPKGVLPATRHRLIQVAHALNIEPDNLIKTIDTVRRRVMEDEIHRLNRLLASETDEITVAGQLFKLNDETIAQLALRHANDPTNLINPVADHLADIFIGNHRLWRGGPVDESLITWVMKKRGIADDPGKAILKIGRAKLTGNQFWGMMQFGNTLRSAWIGLILTARPGFTIINYLDSVSRALLFGARFGDEMPDMLRGLGDWLPTEIRNRFAKFEFEGTNLVDALTTGHFAKPPNMLEIFELGWQQTAGQGRLSQWMNGWYAVNSYFEFMWSTRLFYRKFSDDMLTAQALIMRSVDDLLPLGDDLTRDVAGDLLRRNLNNPAGFDEQLRHATRFRTTKGRPAWSRLYPRETVKRLGAYIGPANARRFFNNVTDALLIEIRTAGVLSEGFVDNLFDEVIEDIARRSDDLIVSTADLRQADGALNLDPKMHNIEDVISEEAMLAKPKPVEKPVPQIDAEFQPNIEAMTASKAKIQDLPDQVFQAEVSTEIDGMLADLEIGRPAQDLTDPEGIYIGRQPSTYPEWYRGFVRGENARNMEWKKGRTALMEKLRAVQRGESAGVWDQSLRQVILDNIRSGVDDSPVAARSYPYFAQMAGESPETVGAMLRRMEYSSFEDYIRRLTEEVPADVDEYISALGEGADVERKLLAKIQEQLGPSDYPSAEAKRIAGVRAARGHRQLANQADRLNFLLDDIDVADESYEQISKAARLVSTTVSNHQELVSGQLQQFMVRQYPGPLVAYGTPRANRWVDYNLMRASLFDAVNEDTRRLLALVDEENYDELAKLWDERAFTSREELLNAGGWRTIWDDNGNLVAISNERIRGGLWWIEDQERIDKFRYAVGAHTEEEFTAPFLRRETREALEREAVEEVTVTTQPFEIVEEAELRRIFGDVGFERSKEAARGITRLTLETGENAFSIAGRTVEGFVFKFDPNDFDATISAYSEAMAKSLSELYGIEDAPAAAAAARFQSAAVAAAPKSTNQRIVEWLPENVEDMTEAIQAPLRKFLAKEIDDVELVRQVRDEIPTEAHAAFDEEFADIIVDELPEIAEEGLEETGAIWDALYNKDYPGGKLNRFSRSVLEDGTKASESPENMIRFLNERVAVLEAKGEDAAATALKQQVNLIEEDLHALRSAAGLEGVARPHKPPPSQWAHGVETHLRSSHHAATTRVLLEETMSEWRSYLKDSIRSGSYITRKLPRESRQALSRWGSQVVDLQAEALETISYGGKFLDHEFDGAVSFVNKIMLDYQNFSRIEKNIKQWINPFWMFPTRSIPMWLDTMLSNPVIPAFYMKYLQSSKRVAYERGGTTSKGQQLPSLAGYLPIPGTDIWFNPLAPFSFRYVFPRQYERYDDEAENITPGQQVMTWVYDNMTMFGFSLAPWVTLPMYKTGLLDEKMFPKRSLIPQLDLIPPGAQRIIMSIMQRSVYPNAPDIWTPEVAWQDFMVERNMLEAALQEILKEGLSPAEKKAIVGRYERALQFRNKRRKDPLTGEMVYIDEEAAEIWNQTMLEYRNIEWARRTIGYFTSIYGKQFTDADAALLELRDEINMLKRSLNDEMLATIFELYPDADQRWGVYRDKRYDTPEGWVQDLYSMLGWTRTTDPETGIEEKLWGQPRRDYISQSIGERQATQDRFTAIDAARKELQDTLLALPIGAPTELTRQAVRDYMAKIGTIESATVYDESRREWIVGYKPKKLVWEDIRNLFWNTVLKTWPGRQDGEEWEDYQARIQDWMNVQFPLMAAESEDLWSQLYAIKWVDPSVNRPENIIENLQLEATYEGYLQWKKDTATPEDAVSMWWTENVWDTYWSEVSGKSGHERNLAEERYMAQWPEGKPTEDDVISGTIDLFESKFTEDEILGVTQGREIYSPDDRLMSQRSIEESPQAAQLEERMWELKKHIPPGQTFDFLKEFKRLGGDETWYWAFIRTGKIFGDFEEFEEQVTLTNKAINNLGYETPSIPVLEEWTKAESQNEQFWATVKADQGEDARNIWNHYWALGYSEQKEFRDDQPTLYAVVESIQELKDTFAAEHPLWQKYYHERYDPDKKKTAGRGGVEGYKPSISTVLAEKYLPLGYRATLDPARLLNPAALGKGGAGGRLVWPKGFADLVSQRLLEEAEAAIQDGEPMSNAGIDFLKKVEERHSEYTDVIEVIFKADKYARQRAVGTGIQEF